MIEVDSLLEEGSGASLFPSSCGFYHEARNPFRPPEDKDIESNVTPRYALLPSKPSATSNYLELPDLEKEGMKNRHKSEGDLDLVEPEKEVVGELEEKTERSTLRPESIKPYQTKMNGELADYFKKLKSFKPIDESWVKSHIVNLQFLKTPRKTLILDLDGTLICSSYRVEQPPAGGKPEVVPMPQVEGSAKVFLLSYYVRPHVKKLLKTLRLFYEIIVFTAGRKLYAKSIIENLDPAGCSISYYLHRSHCAITRDWIVKDLRVIGRRKLKNMVIVDNSVLSFASNLDNGIYVPTFKGDPKDNFLLPVIDFLVQIAHVDDVRPYVRKFAGIGKLLDEYKAV